MKRIKEAINHRLVKMGNVTSAIRAYIFEEIQLNRSNIQQAARSREWFLDRLATAIEKRRNEPPLYYPEPFVYFGSYFKGTKVKAVDEYDVLVVIDSNTGIFSEAGVEIGIGQGSAYPNYKYNQRFQKSDGSGVSPSRMLNWLKGVVQEVTDAFGGEAPERCGQAVTAMIKSRNLKIDLVPAGIFKRYSDDTIFYNIPRGNKANGWIVTSPRTDIELLSNIARDRDNFRNVVRLTKRIKETYNFLVTSFAIETAVILYGIQFDWYNDLFLDVRGVLTYLSLLFRQGSIPDPYALENNLVDGVVGLSWYADRIDRIISELDKCCDLQEQEKVKNNIRKAFENQ